MIKALFARLTAFAVACALALPAHAAVGAPVALGTATATSSGASSLSITVAADVAVGDLVFVATMAAGSSVALSSVTDAGGNTYVLGSPYLAGSDRHVLAYTVAVAPLTAGDSVTITWASSLGRKFAVAGKASGAKAPTADVLDHVGAGAAGSSALPAIETAALAQADSLLIAQTYVTSPLVAFNEDETWETLDDAIVDGRRFHVATRRPGATDVWGYEPWLASSLSWSLNYAAFKGGDGGGPPPVGDVKRLMLLGVGQ